METLPSARVSIVYFTVDRERKALFRCDVCEAGLVIAKGRGGLSLGLEWAVKHSMSCPELDALKPPGNTG